MGNGGAIGVRYEAIDGVFRRLGIDLNDLEPFDDLRVMEQAALSKMANDRARKEAAAQKAPSKRSRR